MASPNSADQPLGYVTNQFGRSDAIAPGERILAGERFSVDMKNQLRELSKREHKPISRIVREATQLYLAKRLNQTS